MQKVLIDFVLKPLIGAVVGSIATAGVDAAVSALRNRKKPKQEPEYGVDC